MSNPTKFTWVDPTTNTDGTPVSTGEITGYTVGVRPASGTAGTYTITVTEANPTATSELLSAITPALKAGDYAAAVMALSTTAGNSAWSTEVTFTITAPPSAPTGFSVA